MRKLAVFSLIMLYFASIFSVSAAVVSQDWTCPPGTQFPVIENGREITVTCSENGSSATLNGCENLTATSGVCDTSTTFTENIQDEGFISALEELDNSILMGVVTVLLISTAAIYGYRN